MPTWIRYLQPSVGTDVLLSYRKVEADVDIPQDAYRIEPPAGYPVRWLSCEQHEILPFEPGSPAPVVGPRVTRPPGPTPAVGSDRGHGDQNVPSANQEEEEPAPVAPAREVKP